MTLRRRESDLRARREEMVEQQIRQRGVTTLVCSRHAVVATRALRAGRAQSSLRDDPCRSRSGQTISQPYIVAYMTGC